MPWGVDPLRAPMFKGPVYKLITQPLYHATKPVSLPLAVGAGNFATRKFRQKPIVGLETAKIRKSAEKKILVNNNDRMPYRKRTYGTKKKSTSRRTFKRRHQRKKRISLLWPRSRVVKFKVVHSGQGASTAAGAIAGESFKANSLNDPTASFSANLPLGVDQWSVFYKKYIVLGSKMTLRVHPTTLTGSCAIGVHLADNNTLLTDHDHYKEMPRTTSRMLSPDIDLATMVMKYSAKKFWKIRNIKDDSEQEATFSTSPGDPTDIAYYQFYFQDIGKTEQVSLDYQVEIEYIVLLTDPTTPSRSSL